jgi:hypothetical protein
MRKKYGGAFGLTDEGIKQLQKYLVVLDGIETRRAEMVKSASRDEVASIDRDAMIFALDVVEVILSCLTGTTRSAMPVLKLQLALKDLRDGNRRLLFFSQPSVGESHLSIQRRSSGELPLRQPFIAKNKTLEMWTLQRNWSLLISQMK